MLKRMSKNENHCREVKLIVESCVPIVNQIQKHSQHSRHNGGLLKVEEDKKKSLKNQRES